MDRIFQSSGACFPYRLHLQSRIVKKMLHETSQILSARQWFFCNPGTFNRPIMSATGWRRVCGGWHAKEVRGRGDLDREESGDPPGHCIEGEPPIEVGAERSLQSLEGLPGTVSFPHRQPANRARWRNRDIFQRLRLCSLVAIIEVFR